MIAGRIRCDFCEFIGEMIPNPVAKTALKVPDGWVSIHPMVTVHGMRGLKYGDPRKDKLDKMKAKIKEKVSILHACGACVSERNVFDIQIALPPGARKEPGHNPMRSANR